MKKFLVTASLLAGIAACNPQIGPFPATMNVRRDMNLQPNDNAPAQPLRAGRSYATTVHLKGNSLLISTGNDTFVFKGAKFDSNANVLTIAPGKSRQVSNGDALGVNGTRRLIGSNSRSYRENRACTRFEQRPITRCTTDGQGRQRCWTDWQDYPVPGTQLVEVTETYETFSVTAAIVGASGATYATLGGQANDTVESLRLLTACF